MKEDLKFLGIGMLIAVYVLGCLVELAGDLNKRQIKELVVYFRELR